MTFTEQLKQSHIRFCASRATHEFEAQYGEGESATKVTISVSVISHAGAVEGRCTRDINLVIPFTAVSDILLGGVSPSGAVPELRATCMTTSGVCLNTSGCSGACLCTQSTLAPFARMLSEGNSTPRATTVMTVFASTHSKKSPNSSTRSTSS